MAVPTAILFNEVVDCDSIWFAQLGDQLTCPDHHVPTKREGCTAASFFHNQQAFQAFERILSAALQVHKVELICFQLMPNHYHLILRPLVDGGMSRLLTKPARGGENGH